MELQSTPKGGGARNKLAAGRVMARDISESLGKLPPQAPDLEEAILGALMLEKTALLAVGDFLKPHHFYVEKHKIIYEAIMGLRTENSPIDMRTVVARLRQVGKLDLVEGAHAIAELTSKATTGGANIEHYARIVMEHALKRNLIEIASTIHTDAYDDTTDVFELRDKIDLYLKVADESIMGQSKEDKIKLAWEERHLTTEPKEPPPLIMIDTCPVAQVGNHTLIVGKKKARKTLFMVGLLSQFIKTNPQMAAQVAIFDTEQGKGDVYAMRKKIFRLTGVWISVFYLRGMRYQERLRFIIDTVKYWPVRLRLIVIDGIRDLIGDILDSEESANLIYEIEKLQLEHELAVLNVLHLNKTDGNARGHLGSELTNKAICTIELSKDAKTDVTVVKCESSRGRPFEDYAFTHGAKGSDEEGLPVGANMPRVALAKATTFSNPEEKKRLQAVFADGEPMKTKDVLDAIKANFEVGHGRAKVLLATMVLNGQVLKNGKDRDPKQVYKLITLEPAMPLMTTPTPIHQPPVTSTEMPADNLDQSAGNWEVDDLPF